MTVTANPAVPGGEGGATGGAEQGWPHDAGPHIINIYIIRKSSARSLLLSRSSYPSPPT